LLHFQFDPEHRGAGKESFAHDGGCATFCQPTAIGVIGVSSDHTHNPAGKPAPAKLLARHGQKRPSAGAGLRHHGTTAESAEPLCGYHCGVKFHGVWLRSRAGSFARISFVRLVTGDGFAIDPLFALRKHSIRRRVGDFTRSLWLVACRLLGSHERATPPVDAHRSNICAARSALLGRAGAQAGCARGRLQ